MRGKVSFGVVEDILDRITPAYAGKSCLCHADRSNNWDHPRLCGEKTKCRSVTATVVGSPPPMRGKDDLLPQNRINHRITPAYAGKS